MNWPFDSLIRDVFLPIFQKEGEAGLPFLVNSNISKMAFLSAYKELPPIEEMPEKEKREMKQYVVKLFPNKSVQEKLEACKIIYTIGTIV